MLGRKTCGTIRTTLFIEKTITSVHVIEINRLFDQVSVTGTSGFDNLPSLFI